MEYLCYAISICCFLYIVLMESNTLRVERHANELLNNQIDELKGKCRESNELVQILNNQIIELRKNNNRQESNLRTDFAIVQKSLEQHIEKLNQVNADARKVIQIKLDETGKEKEEKEELSRKNISLLEEIAHFQTQIDELTDMVTNIKEEKDKEIQRLNLIKKELIGINHAYSQKIRLTLSGIKSYTQGLESLVDDKQLALAQSLKTEALALKTEALKTEALKTEVTNE